MDVNEATVNITGLNRDVLINSDFFNYFTEQQKARKLYQQVFEKGSVADSPLTVKHKNGKLTVVLFNGSVYKDDKGNVVGVVIVARDVMDQKKIASQLEEARFFAELATEIAEEAKIKCIDLVYLNQRTKSNPTLMMEMISLYLVQTPPLISAIKQSLEDQNWQLLSAAAHKMIPSFAIMGMSPNFENIAKKIQKFAIEQEKSAGIDNLVIQLEDICIQACQELQEEFNILKNTI